MKRDNDGHKRGNGGGESENRTLDNTLEDREEGKRQIPIKLEIKIARDARLFNCMAKHTEWFDVVRSKDSSARIISFKEIAIKEV